jgi:hypothetical protein
MGRFVDPGKRSVVRAKVMGRLSWPQIQSDQTFRGRWVALCDCVLDDSRRPLAGSVIDCDEDLVALCSRIRDGGGRRCTICYCDEATRTVH